MLKGDNTLQCIFQLSLKMGVGVGVKLGLEFVYAEWCSECQHLFSLQCFHLQGIYYFVMCFLSFLISLNPLVGDQAGFCS